MNNNRHIFMACSFAVALSVVGHVFNAGFAHAKELPDMVVDERALQSLKKEIGELKARLRESEGKLIEKEAYLRKILKEKEQYALELDAVKSERMHMDAELEDLRARLASTEESFSAQIASEKGLLNDKLLSMEKLLKEREGVAAKVIQDRGAVEKKISDLEQENIHLQKMLEGSQKKVLDTQDEVTWKIYAMRQPLEDKISSLEGTIKNNEAAVQEITQNFAQVDAQLKKEQEQKAKIETELFKVKKELADAKTLVANRMQEVRGPLEGKIRSLEHQLAQSNTAIAQRESVVEAAAVREEALRKDLEAFTADNAALNDKIGSLQGQVKMMEDELPLKISAATKSLEDELAVYESRLQETVSMVKERQVLLKDVLTKNEGLTHELNTVKNELNMATGEKESAVRELSSVNQQLYDMEKVLGQEIDALKKRREEDAGQIAALTQTRDDLSDEVTALKEEKARLDREFAMVEGDLSDTQAMIPQRIQEARKPLEDQIRSFELLLKESKNDLSGRVAHIEKLNAQIDDLNKSLVTEQDAGKRSREDLTNAKSELDRTKALIPKEVAAVRVPLEERIAALEGVIKQRDAMITEISKQRQQLESSLNAVNVKKDSLGNELLTVQDQLRETKGVLGQEIDALKKRGAQDAGQITALVQVRDKLSDDLAVLRDDKEGLKKELARAEGDLSDTQAMIPQKIREVSQPLENQIRLYEEQLKASQSDLSGRAAHVEELNAQINELNTRLLAQQAAEKELEEELASTRGDLERALASIPKEVAAVRTPLEDTIIELTKSVKTKEEAIALLNGRLDQTTQELLKEQGTKKGLEDQLAKIMDELVRTKALIPEQIDAVRRPLEEQMRSYEAQLKSGKDDLSARAASIAGLNQQVDALQSKLSAEQASRKKLEEGLALSQADLERTKVLIPAEVEAVRVPLEKEVEGLENTVAAKETEVGRLKERLDQVGQELAKEQEAKAVLEGRLVKLDEDLTKAKTSVPQQILAAKTPLEARVVALEGMIQERDAVIASMKEQKDEADVNFKKLGDEKGLLVSELASLKTQLGETKTSLGQELAGLKQKGADDAGQIAALLKANEHLNSKLASLQDENKALEEVLVRAKIDMEKTQALIPEKVASVREVLEGNIASLEEMLAQKNDLLLAATNNVNSLEAKLNEMNSRNSLLESELADVSDRLKKSEISISQNMDALRRPMEKEIIELETKLKSTEAQVQESAPRLGALLKERDTFKSALDESQMKNQTLAGELVKLQRMYEGAQSSLGGQLQGYERTIREKEAVITDLMSSRDKIKEDFAVSENARMRLEDELAMVQGRLEETRTQIPEKVLVVQKPLEEKIRLYEQQLTGVNAELGEKEAFVRELTQRLDKLTKELVDTQREKHGLKESLTRMEAEMQANVNLLTRDLSDEKVSLVAEISSLKKALNEKTALVSDSAWQRDSLRNELNAINEKKIALEKEVALLRDQLKNSEMSVSQSMDTLRRPLEKEIIDLEAQLKAADARSKEKDGLIAQGLDKQKALAGELDALTREKNLAERELSTIRLQLQSADTALLPKIEEAKRPLEEKVASLTAQLHNVDNVIGQRVQENQILYEQRIKAIEQKLKDSESGLKEKDIIIKELLQRKTETERELARTEEEKASLQVSLEELNAKLHRSREDLTVKMKDAESRSKVFKEDMTDRTVDLIEIRNELRSAMDLIRSSE